MSGITPQEKRGPGYVQFTNPGMGQMKIGSGANGHGGGAVGHVHHRPSSSEGTEFAAVKHDGTGLCKSE